MKTIDFFKQTAILIQARSGSSRLPNKIYFPYQGRPALLNLYQVCSSNNDCFVLGHNKDHNLISFCDNFKMSLRTFDGENDVIGRYYNFVKKHDYRYFLRVTADCFMISESTISIFLLRCCSAVQDGLIRGLYSNVFPIRCVDDGFDLELVDCEQFIKYYEDNLDFITISSISREVKEHVLIDYQKLVEVFNDFAMKCTGEKYSVDTMEDYLRVINY